MARTVFEKQDVIPLLGEVFRALGYDGASMSAITARTGLSKSSLYHFFPNGKEEMAAAVLAHVDGWFIPQIFEPLERDEPAAAIGAMWAATDAYFRSGRRICLMGAFALDETRDKFAEAIKTYFDRWISALAAALRRAGLPPVEARGLAEATVGGIQGALTLARAVDDDAVFGRLLGHLEDAVQAAMSRHARA